MKPYELVLFDFDGTLYDSEAHFDTYIDLIGTHLNDAQAKQLRKLYERTRAGEGVLRIGEWYDPESQVSKPADATHPSNRKYYLGDYWWLIHTLGHRLGVTDEQLIDSFFRTRDYMMTHTDEIHLVVGLKEWLQTVAKRQKPIAILATNSPEPDSVAILQQLGVYPYFTEMIYNARKPTHMPQILEHVSTTYQVPPNRMLCVGDHYYNDIDPALQFGADTLFINRHRVSHPHNSTYEVHTSEALMEYLTDILAT